MAINIPQGLEDLLSEDRELYGATILALADFEPWLDFTSPPFFPEYTDHGPKHIESVLSTAFSLISDEALPVLTGRDASILILAVLLHDIGMHITENSFIELVHPELERDMIREFDTRPWHLLWQEFLAEASRFSARKLIEIFGDPEPIGKPRLEASYLTDRDKLLIGEFVRRNHPRLAHEIALFGIPSSKDSQIRLHSSVSADIADIAGLVARSHGIELRSALDYLAVKYHRREYSGIHAMFLMVLVRIADFLQVQSIRAPKQVLNVRKLRSPISRREWSAHHSIRSITHSDDDPEALYIDAVPEDVHTYLRVTLLLRDIQRELDVSWAVLGEVYGRFEELNCLGLNIRRIRSNLDNKTSFSKSAKFFPVEAAFEAADSDLLKLLVEPLYGNRPEIGIRELIQNAIDAVIECRELQSQRLDLRGVQQLDLDADVVVVLEEEDGLWKLRISDRGIGMSLETVRNYFLKAGASIRKSEYWRSRFESDLKVSQVMRSGRFGVGVLAAFLLGKEITVKTRHLEAGSDDGILFKASIDTDQIELKRTIAQVGTFIEISLYERVAEKLLANPACWDWYFLEDPKVLRSVNRKQAKTTWIGRTIVQTKGHDIPSQYVLPKVDAHLPPGWRRLPHANYRDIQWTYNEVPALTCNGLLVMKKAGNRNGRMLFSWKDYIRVAYPNLSIFDFNGRLPLNLERTDVNINHCEFFEELGDSVIDDFLAYVLVNAPLRHFLLGGNERFFRTLLHPGAKCGILRSGGGVAPWFCTEAGVAFNDLWHISNLVTESLLIVAPAVLNGVRFSSSLVDETCVFQALAKKHDSTFGNWVEFALTGRSTGGFEAGPVGLVETRGRRFLARESDLTHRQILLNLPKNSKEEMRLGKWIVLSSGDCPKESPLLNNWEKDCLFTGSFAEWYVNDIKEPMELSILGRKWKEIVVSPIIPFDAGERKERLKGAFERLFEFVQANQRERPAKAPF